MLTHAGGLLAGRPPHRRDDARAHLPVPAARATPRRRSPAPSRCPPPAPSRCRARPACRPSSPTTRSTGSSGARPRRRPGSPTPTRRAGCPATSRPPRRPRSTATPRRPGCRASAPTRRSAPRSPTTSTKPRTLTGLTLQVIADGRHSVPTTMTMTSGSVTRTVALPPIADSTVPNAVTTVPVSFPGVTGSHFVLTFTGIRPEYAANYYSAGPLALPLGIAEVGIPGVRSAPTPADLPGTCVSNLLSIDGRPIDVAVVGSAPHALDNGEAQLVPCGPDAKGITLGAGPHIVQTAVGHNPPCANAPTTCTGWNIDQLALDSAAGGGPGPAVFPTTAGTPLLAATQPGPAPTVTATSSHIDAPRRGRHRRRPALRARPRRERQQGLAGGGRARPRRAGGLAPGGPGAAPAGGRLRQRVARHRGRPARAGRARLHGRADLDPPARGVGRAGRLGGHAARVPGPRLPPGALGGAACVPTCPAACAGRRDPTRRSGRDPPSTPPPWPGPGHRHPRRNASAAGCASRGRCSSAP